MAERVVVRNTQSPGDFIVMSAAIRDLSRAHPGRFEFMVDVPQYAVYQHNPYLKAFLKNQAGVREVVGQYPAIHQSNQRKGVHFVWGFIEDLNQKLKANAVLTEFRPDLHLSAEEKATVPLGVKKPYWVFVSGGKKDYTAKWWDPTCWQIVVDEMTKKGITMVQVGGGSHVHPPLKNVFDLYGKTSFRELMQLIYHSDGVMAIVTCLMHIAAAFNKPCVTVAGGREPWWWEAYNEENRITNMRKGQPNWVPPPNDDFVPHKYLHTMGLLDCCKTTGCWKSRIEPIVGGSVCLMPAKQNNVTIPKCMQLITPDIVTDAADWYYENGLIRPPNRTLVQTTTAQDPVAVIRTDNPEEIKKALAVATTRWVAWVDDTKGVKTAGRWLPDAIARLERKSAAAGGMVCWAPEGGGKKWRMKPGIVLLNREKVQAAGVPESLDDLCSVLFRQKMPVVNIGDLVGYL